MNFLFSFLLIALLLGIAGLYLYTLFIAKRVELGMPPEGSFVTVMGNRIHYVEQGSGPETIVLIHGLTGVVQNFGYGLISDLARQWLLSAA